MIQEEIQEKQYVYPYHYLPEIKNGNFSQTQHWDWGFRYLGGIQFVLNLLKGISFHSLIDVGCGDARLLSEIFRAHPNKKLYGVDFSERAIALGKALNPQLILETRNILENPFAETFDLVTCVEVLEHIPPHLVSSFIERLSGQVVSGGYLILTVPHINAWPIAKHFQHFDSVTLLNLFKPYFKEISVHFFDKKSLWLKIFQAFLGANGKQFIVTNRWLNNLFYRFYLKIALEVSCEKQCLRVALVCRK